MVSTIEWITFSFTQKYGGAQWKGMFADSPFLMRQIFKNNFKTPLGLTAVMAGLQSLPIFLYISRHDIFFFSNSAWFGYLIAYCWVGRFLSFIAEVY